MATYTIGRSDENSIVLNDSTVSRQHAELETRKQGTYLLRDLDSTYGTKIFRDGEWLNVIEVEVTDNTEVTFGEFRTMIGEIVGMASADVSPATERPPAPAAQPAVEPKAQPAPAPAAAATPPPAGRAPAGSTSGSGMDKRTIMFLAIGGGVLVLAIIIGLVLALLIGGPDTANIRAGLTPSTISPPAAPKAPDNTPRTPDNTPRTPETQKPPAAPTNTDRAEFEAALVRSCTRQGRFNDSQCQCLAKHMSEALTREELAIFVALRRVRNDQEKLREIIQRFGAQKVAAIGQKMTSMVDKVRQQCGVSLRR